MDAGIVGAAHQLKTFDFAINLVLRLRAAAAATVVVAIEIAVGCGRDLQRACNVDTALHQGPGNPAETQRYDVNGNPIDPEEAHPGPSLPTNPLPPLLRLGTFWGVLLSVVLYSPPAY